MTTSPLRHGPLTGDLWVEAFWVEVPLVWRSKSNFRRGGNGAWAEQSRFEADLTRLVQVARPSTWDAGNPGTPLSDRPVVVSAMWAGTLLDAGNLSKSALDACEGVLYVNDASVRGVASFSSRTSSPSEQSGAIAFARLAAPSARGDVFRATSLLSNLLLEEIE